MQRRKLLRRIIRTNWIFILILIIRWSAISTPMTPVFTGSSIKDHYPAVPVSIGYENFVSARLHVEICWTAQMSWVITPHVDTGLTDGEHVLSFSRELHYMKSIARA